MCTYCGTFAHNASVDVSDAATSTSTAGTVSGKSIWSVEQIADQLTDGYWEASGRTSRKFDISADGTLVVDLTGLTEKGLAAARSALAAWTAATGISFVEYVAGSSQKVSIQFIDDYSGAYTSSSVSNGTITKSYINISDSFASGAYFLQTYIHEIGHALGLGHAGNYNGSGSFSSQALYANDTWQYSIMSYFYQTQSPDSTASFLYVSTPQIADVLAIQNLYGVSTKVHAGATVYGDGGSVSIVNNRAQTIVDAGGIDEINLSTRSKAQYLDLNDGSFSNIGGYTGNLAIAIGTMIENATTGSGADTIIGNELGNLIKSGAGNDIVTAGAGNDTVYGQDGNDSIDGGAGDDLLIGGAGNDTIDGGAGTDTVQYSVKSTDVAFLVGADGVYVDGSEGLDLLINTEQVTFADTTFDVSDIEAVFAKLDGSTWLTGADLAQAIIALSAAKVVEDTTTGSESSSSVVSGETTQEPTVLEPVATVEAAGHMEVGQLDLSTTDGWIHITFDQAIANAIVVIGAVTENGDTPVVTEVTNVTSTGFDLRLTGYNYTSLETALQSLSWMAGSAGTYYLEDGSRVTFGETKVTGEKTTTVAITDYDNSSLVFGSLEGTGSTTMIARIDSDTSSTGFTVQMQAEESERGTVGTQTRSFNYVVIELASDSIVSGGSVTASSTAKATGADSDLALFADMSTKSGLDTSIVGYTEDAYGNISVRVIEEQSKDAETTHINETITWANVASGSYNLYDSIEDAAIAAGEQISNTSDASSVALEVGTLSFDPANADADGWVYVAFSDDISDPVVVLGPISNADGEPVVAELSNITSSGFYIRLSEYNYQDGEHGVETISWMAGSEGSHQLSDGTVVTFGTQTVTGEKAVALNYETSSTPILLASLEIDETATATYRLSDVDSDGATVKLQVQELLTGTQSGLSATVQWVTIEAGNGSLVSTGTAGVSSSGEAISADTTEALFADMQTLNGGNTASLRYELTDDTFILTVAEEQSKDAEVDHLAETVAWVSIDEGRYSFVDNALADATLAQSVLENAVYEYL